MSRQFSGIRFGSKHSVVSSDERGILFTRDEFVAACKVIMNVKNHVQKAIAQTHQQPADDSQFRVRVWQSDQWVWDRVLPTLNKNVGAGDAHSDIELAQIESLSPPQNSCFNKRVGQSCPVVFNVNTETRSSIR